MRKWKTDFLSLCRSSVWYCNIKGVQKNLPKVLWISLREQVNSIDNYITAPCVNVPWRGSHNKFFDVHQWQSSSQSRNPTRASQGRHLLLSLGFKYVLQCRAIEVDKVQQKRCVDASSLLDLRFLSSLFSQLLFP